MTGRDGQCIGELVGDSGHDFAEHAELGGALDLRIEELGLIVGPFELPVERDLTLTAPAVGLGEDGGEDADDVQDEEVERGHPGAPRRRDDRSRQPADVLHGDEDDVAARRNRGGDDTRGARKHEPAIEGHDRVHGQEAGGIETAHAPQADRDHHDVHEHAHVRLSPGPPIRPPQRVVRKIQREAKHRLDADDRVRAPAGAEIEDVIEDEDEGRHRRADSQLLAKPLAPTVETGGVAWTAGSRPRKSHIPGYHAERGLGPGESGPHMRTTQVVASPRSRRAARAMAVASMP